MKKSMALWLMVLVFGLCGPAVAQNAEGLRISYDVGGRPVTFLRDGAGLVQVNGLDVPGLVLYRPINKTVYYQHPAWPRWLAVTPASFDGFAAETLAVPGAAWTPFLDQPVRRWELSAGGQGCGTWFGSAGMSGIIGVRADDFLRILGVLNWLNGGRQVDCQAVLPRGDFASQLGWPVRWQTGRGTWQLREVVRVGLDDFVLPADVMPVTDEARLALMMTQLTDMERKAFVRDAGQLPLVQQLELLEEMLAEGVE